MDTDNLHFIVDCLDCFYEEGTVRESSVISPSDLHKKHYKKIKQNGNDKEATRHLFYLNTGLMDVSSFFNINQLRLQCELCEKIYEVTGADYYDAMEKYTNSLKLTHLQS